MICIYFVRAAFGTYPCLELQVPGKIQHILCTGNLCTKETLDYLKSIAGDVTVVRGEFDEVRGLCCVRVGFALIGQNTAWPDTKVITLGQFKIGLSHGHTVVPWGDKARVSHLLLICKAVFVEI